MVQYHTSRNELDPTWCLSQVLKSATDQSADVLLLSDLRTLADLEYFQLQSAAAFHHEAIAPTPNLILVRVNASDDARAARGWQSDDTKDLLPTLMSLVLVLLVPCRQYGQNCLSLWCFGERTKAGER